MDHDPVEQAAHAARPVHGNLRLITLEDLWTYRPPTEETAPKYATIREAAATAQNTIDAFLAGRHVTFEDVKVVTLGLARLIEEYAPDCADRTTAIRQCRLARMAMNEAVALRKNGAARPPSHEMQSAIIHAAVQALLEARWWACSAIALG